MTTIKSRKPLVETSGIAPIQSKNVISISDEMTVEAFLEFKCDEIIKDLYRHGEQLCDRLREEFDENSSAIKALMAKSSSDAKKVCVTLKCIGGPHIGQKFRLEPNTDNGEDSFKMGRSSGKHFKEKGVSLYKDKEISTTHAKIEIRNGQVFLIDVRSTNGTQLNGADVEPQAPMKLNNDDVILMGGSELQVVITDFDDLENVDSISL
jgi:hypothetical protein